MEAAYRTLLLRLIGFFIYIFVGGAIFMQIEQDKTESALTLSLEGLRSEWMVKYNLSRETIAKMLRDYDNVKASTSKPKWTYSNSVYFVVQLATTIGYGNITPITTFGQIFTMIYATVGIPITILALKSIGELVNIGLRIITRPCHRRFHGPHCSETSCNFLEKGGICVNLTILIFLWIISSIANAYVDPDLEVVSNIYSIYITYATVGFGDFIPFENHKYAVILCILPGLSFMSSFIDSVLAYFDKNNGSGKSCFDLTGCLPDRVRAEESTNGAQENRIDEDPM